MFNKFNTIVIALLMSISLSSLGKDIALGYPELMVSPKASTRIKMEVKKEKAGQLTFNWGTSLSATMTILTSVFQLGGVDETKDIDKVSPKVGLLVGASWLAANALLSYRYKGYQRAYNEIKRLPTKTMQQRLVKERLAEEQINSLGRVAKKLKWFSFLSNAAANGYMVSKAKSNSTAQIMGAVSILTSFVPLLFESRWETVMDNQKDYKKRIYGPVVSSTVFMDNQNRVIPGLLLSLSF